MCSSNHTHLVDVSSNSLLVGGDAITGECRAAFGRYIAYRSFWPKMDDVAEFAERGIDLVCIYPSNTANSLGVDYSSHAPNWIHFGVYDWESLDRQFDEIIEVSPNAKFLCMIDLNTPGWLTRFSRFDDTFYGLGKTVSSTDWRKHTTEYMRAFLLHCEEKYGQCIEGYILSCGATCEWQDASRGEESASRLSAWKKWSVERGYGEPLDLPLRSQRVSAAHGLLRDPELDAQGVRYWTFNNSLIADSILHFAAEAKAFTGRRIPIGVFYGYVMEYGRGRIASFGHLGYDKVFASDDIDFLISPGTYCDREMGGSSGYMSLIDSIKLHRKGFIREIDHFTHTANGNPLAQWGIEWGDWNHRWNDETSSVSGLRREFCLALITGVSLWWFDMWNHWYEAPEIKAELDGMKAIWDSQLSQCEAGSVAEIAVLVDAESCLYLNESDPDSDKVLRELRKPLGHIGAPYKLFSTADIDAIDFTPFKLVIFPNLFHCAQKMAERIERNVKSNGRTILWIHLAGVISDAGYDKSHVEAMTGMPYQPGEITTRAFAQWTSVLHSDLLPTDSALRDVAKAAGVHLYQDNSATIYANERLVAAHSKDGGRQVFHLPKMCQEVRELFSNRIVATNCQHFEDTLGSPSTVLYEIRYKD